ncbi:hypothetical protein D3C72_2080280 [compost metagenome]
MSPLLRKDTVPPFRYAMPPVRSGDMARFDHRPAASSRARALSASPSPSPTSPAAISAEPAEVA